MLADSAVVDPATLKALDVPFPIQFLAINTPESPQNDSLRAAARALKAPVEPIRIEEDSDVAAMVRRAAGAQVAQSGKEGGRWSEAGYWLVPLIGLIVLTGFRRETPAREPSA